MGVSRRTLLGGAVALTGAAVALRAPWVADATAPTTTASPFTLGVASGDPTPDGVVLWTRLAPDPLAPDGLGGMPSRPVLVEWEVAADAGFRAPLARGSAVARAEDAHAVHVEVAGLRPAAEHFYRFRVGTEISPVGRARTAPAPGARVDRFAFAIASCQSRPDGYYNAHAAIARDDLDLVAWLGDYIYESAAVGVPGRAHLPAREAVSLADYRLRHGQYRSDPDLQAAHAAAPWAVTIDDHDVENNWAGDVSQVDDEPDNDPAVFRARRADAYRAFWEHMPLRRAQRPQGPEMRMHRRLTFGDLLDLHLLDTRRYRTDQDPKRPRDRARTMLGAEQRAWLTTALAGPTARWNALGQQVFFSPRDLTAGPATGLDEDSWDDCAAERDALRDHLVAARTPNPVILTGDVHAAHACDVRADFTDPSSRVVATELVTTSISSGGNGSARGAGDAALLAENPHIRFVDRRRGYVRNVVTPREWRADFQVLDTVSTRGAPARTATSVVIPDGDPGARA
ncbi:alkaline phosphatase D family protein [Actinomycetospora chibensis]|uniref:Alkaline phosphatase D family protein n=1 Tax=Actinomycetospora chibensis TaxID=663606 RepID=A0ABV9RR75_9PSEU|nr:alkaline phosphatase D family protein [Actinomycetospora chibensis]MDD7925296.1 alkaline phosphatase D family protein [Actinomycetospora chibensis]